MTQGSWRKQATHQAETKAVKAGLKSAGFTAINVTHGTGTGWSWLDIKLAATHSFDDTRQAIRVAQEITGRTGDYNGEISCTVEWAAYSGSRA